MKRTKTGIGIVLFMAVFIMGCGNTIPELSEEQQNLIVEYAAGTLLKYDKNHEQKLLDVSMLPEEVPVETKEVTADESSEGQLHSEEQTALHVEESGNVQAGDTIDHMASQAADTQNISIQEFLQIDDFVFRYSGYEVTTDYPGGEETMYFVMSASEGNQLLVMKFLVENVSESESELDMHQIGARFKIKVDGEEKNALTTMLLNDLAHYQGALAAGESTELVLVREISEEQAESLTNLELIVKNVDNTATISLN